MTNRTTYPSYKPSGIDWLGDIPSHWRMQRLGALLAETKKLNTDLSVDQILSLTRDRGVIPYEDKGNVGNKASEDISRYKVVEIGDLVLNSMNVIIGSVGLSKLRGSLSPVYYVLRSRNDEELSMQYAAAIFSLPTYQDSLKRIGNGILAHRMRIPWEALKNENLPLPPLDEQRAIADYLDRKDAEITRFIESRRRMIALLEEKKQAIINQAVTRGLDPSVPMKDSGVEWLGEIPAHWEVRRLKQVAHLHRGYDLPAISRIDGEYPVISSGGVAGYHHQRMATGPGVVMGRYGSTQNLFFVESDYWPHNTSLYVDDFFGNYPRFVYWLIGTLNIAAFSEKSAVPGVDRKDLHEIATAYPPLNEQAAISDFLDRFLQELAHQRSLIEREIELMQEYRTRLISDVVTGKVRVD